MMVLYAHFIALNLFDPCRQCNEVVLSQTICKCRTYFVDCNTNVHTQISATVRG